MARRGRPTKHTVYYELVEACTAGGCPVCAMALATVTRYLESVIYENVNDPATRDGVVAARGYCNDHSWQLRDMTAALGTALMYRDVLRHVAEEIGRRADGQPPEIFPRRSSRRGGLASLARGGRSSDPGPSEADPHTTCPACRTRDRYELLYLGTLLDHLDDQELMAAFRRSGGLCLVHLDQARRATRDVRALDRLLGVQRELLMALHEELSEFIRKSDYRFRGEAMGAEADSWLRALEAVAGKPGIR